MEDTENFISDVCRWECYIIEMLKKSNKRPLNITVSDRNDYDTLTFLQNFYPIKVDSR